MARRPHDELRIDLEQLPEDGVSVSVDHSHPRFAALLADAADGKDEEGAAAPVGSVDVTVTPWPQRLDVVGTLTATLPLVCSRGLDGYSHELTVTFSHILMRSPGGSHAEEVELTADDLDRSEFTGTELDLITVLREELFLGMPGKPLCTTPCEGPCPNWGEGVTLGTVGEDDSSGVDPRWAALAALKNKN